MLAMSWFIVVEEGCAFGLTSACYTFSHCWRCRSDAAVQYERSSLCFVREINVPSLELFFFLSSPLVLSCLSNEDRFSRRLCPACPRLCPACPRLGPTWTPLGPHLDPTQVSLTFRPPRDRTQEVENVNLKVELFAVNRRSSSKNSPNLNCLNRKIIPSFSCNADVGGDENF